VNAVRAEDASPWTDTWRDSGWPDTNAGVSPICFYRLIGDRLCRNEWHGQGRAMKIIFPNRQKNERLRSLKPIASIVGGDDVVAALRRRVMSLMRRFHGGFEKIDFNFD